MANILYVEDQEEQRHCAQRAFASLGIETVQDAAMAISKLEGPAKPRIVIIDLLLNGTMCLDLCESAFSQEVPAILYTGVPDWEVEVVFEKSLDKFASVWQKPVILRDKKRELETYLR